jgi:ATP-binding cassette, subfamily B, bacterial
MPFWSRFFPKSSRSQFYGGDVNFKDSLSALRYLPPFLRLIWQTHPLMAGSNVLLRLLESVIPVSTLYVGKLIIDEVVYLINVPEGDFSSLWLYVGLELALAVASAALNRGINLLDALLGDLFANQTSLQLIEQAARLDLPQFENATFYDKLERARRQTTGRVVLMSQLLRQAQDLVTMTFLAVGLVVFNPWLILLLVVAVIPSFLSETHFNQHSYSITRNWTPERRQLDYLRYVGASDRTAKEVKIFGLNDFLTDRFDELASRYYQANRGLAVRRAGWGWFFNLLGDLAYYGAYAVIILQTVSGTLSLGDLTFLSGSFRRLRGLLQGVLFRFSAIAKDALYLKDWFEFMALEPEITSPPEPVPMPAVISQGFAFEGVSFRYPGTDKYALQDLSFQLRVGEKLALVGENGAGKTTLVKLLARLYDPSEGRILLDGRDLREYDLHALRRKVGVIFQDYERFQLPVAENIAVGDIEGREDLPRIEQAAVKSLADKVVAELPGGYQQMLGRRFENGIDLSGGQWQKVALARAYMREAQLLILDEPTSALDARAEYEVFERFAELTKGKTAVLISHRFSTVRMADRILVLEGGKRIELGSHAELLAAGGTYAELFQLQARGYQ